MRTLAIAFLSSAMLASLSPVAMAHDETGAALFEAMAKNSAGQLAPLQMADGSKQWRFVHRALKGDAVELRLADLIAQALAGALWCSNGWEESKRTEASGMIVVEGRCK